MLKIRYYAQFLLSLPQYQVTDYIKDIVINMSQHHEKDPTGIEMLDETAIKSEQFLEKYLLHILATVGVLILAVGGYYAYQRFIAEPAEERAAIALFKAEDRFINGLDSLALKGEGITSKGLEAIIKDYSGSDAANLAHAYKGIALYDAGQYQEAIESLKQFKAKDAYLAPSIQRLIGDAYAELAQYQEAANSYEKAAKMASNEAISPSCLIKAGHAYEKLGNKRKALELYRSIKEKYYNASEAQTVEADIIRASAE